MQPHKRDQTTAERMASVLGWFSIALGLAEALAARKVASLIGVPHNTRTLATLRTMGVREVAAGLGVLGRPGRPGPLWSRVAGDALDLSLLGAAYRMDRARPGRLTGATAAVAGVTIADVLCASRLSRPDRHAADGSVARRVE